jgi:hypothetical protein
VVCPLVIFPGLMLPIVPVNFLLIRVNNKDGTDKNIHRAMDIYKSAGIKHQSFSR